MYFLLSLLLFYWYSYIHRRRSFWIPTFIAEFCSFVHTYCIPMFSVVLCSYIYYSSLLYSKSSRTFTAAFSYSGPTLLHVSCYYFQNVFNCCTVHTVEQTVI
jgi:hypothetical protein